MKKLSFALALILACGVLASCGDDSTDTTAAPGDSGANSSTPAATSGTPTSSDPAATSNTPAGSSDPVTSATGPVAAPSTPASNPGDEPKDALIDGSRFTVDGDLSDWEGLATMEVIGEAFTAGKKATFYGVTTTDGLYLACDAYHEIYSTGDETWWKNSNFEFFIDTDSEQMFVYADGIGAVCKTGAGGDATGKITQAVMVTTEINEDPAKYHTITEVFISNDDLPEDVFFENTISIGMAWKTVSDLIIGGQYHVNADGSDEYWAVKGDDDTHNGEHAAPRCAMVATPKGLYWFDDYMD